MIRKLCILALPLVAYSITWFAWIYYDVAIRNQADDHGLLGTLLPLIALISLFLLARSQFKPTSIFHEIIIGFLCVLALSLWFLINVPLVLLWHTSLGGTL